ncbi:MAG: tRNA lysidine(34) synthetase TilS [Hyphomicrobium sp.]|nr:MAG: tRNA lysidine(34) synthetase TilS [Hyphomicrobium sp.]
MTTKSYDTRDVISIGDADVALNSLASFETLLLAVSGGADSMALLELVAEWRTRRRSLNTSTVPQVFVATVDHGLRQESVDEASFVAARCAALDLPHATLLWAGQKSKPGLANSARVARYRLLREHLDTLAHSGSCAVVTAHTRDDQAETVLMRLARGSGCEGLSAMAPSRAMAEGDSVQLVRPLLIFTKSQLAAMLSQRRLTWCEDPSNGDDTYERVRVRRAMATFESVGLTSAALARTAHRMQVTRDALDYADQAFVESVGLSFHHEVFASFDCGAFERAPLLLRVRLLARLIRRYGGASSAPDLQDVEHLVEHCATTQQARMTLGGVVVSKGQRTVRLWREPGRLAVEDLTIPHGSSSLWDGRFWLNRSGAHTDISVFVRPLGASGYRQIVKSLNLQKSLPPAGAVQALPAFYSGQTLICVPGLATYAPMLANHANFTGLELTTKAARGAY